MSHTNPSAKRKRTSQFPKDLLKSSPTDQLQPSSRDASGEELAESPVANSRHKKNVPSIEFSNAQPPSKRPRTRASAAAEKNTYDTTNVPSIANEDPGEPSLATTDSADIEEKAQSGRPRGNSKTDEKESTPLAEVPKAGMRDPVGYHTNPPPTGRPVRIYADGVFDLFHLGHMRQLQQAKIAFPEVYLIVGVTGDAETHKRKGLTVLTGAERAESVRHCKWVDEVLPNCPWIVTAEFLEKWKIDYVAHDDEPYVADEGDDIYKPIKEQGKFLVTQRTEGVSTTGIITKIVRDYEKYIARQLKRGTSRQELNVSWLKKNELDLRRHVTELRESIRNNWTSTGSEIGKDLRLLWQSSRPSSPARANKRSLDGDTPRNKTALDHLKHLEIPGSLTRGRNESPGAMTRSEDFASGYSLGLIGGVRSWMMRGRKSLRDSQPASPTGSEEDDESSHSSGSGIGERSAGRGHEKKPSAAVEDSAMETTA